MKIFLRTDDPKADIQRVLEYWEKHRDTLIYGREEEYTSGDPSSKMMCDYIVLNIKHVGIIQLLNRHKAEWVQTNVKTLLEEQSY